MGSRGQGKKGGKRGTKGKKGGKPSNKWGDEHTVQDDDRRVKKRPRITQESQDREQRMRVIGLARAKERDRIRRLSQPNLVPVLSEAPEPKAARKRKRKRPVEPAALQTRRLLAPYCPSSDEEAPTAPAAESEQRGRAGSGLANYKQLLSSLTKADPNAPALEGDKDLADALSARRMQTHGQVDAYDSASSASGEPGRDEDVDSDSDDLGSGTDDEKDDDEEEARGAIRSEGEEDPAVQELKSAEEKRQSEENDEERELALAADSNLDGDEEASMETTASGHVQDGFSRHFATARVFPPEQASTMLSEAKRPSFKPLGTGRREWEAGGLAVSTSKGVDRLPSPLTDGSCLTRELRLPPSLANQWEGSNHGPPSKLQSLVLPTMTSYFDMLYCGWRDEEAGALRRCYAIHALNHVLTSRRRVLRHTARLRREAEHAKLAAAVGRGKAATSTNQRGVVGNGAANRKGQRSGSEGPADALNGAAAPAEAEEWQRDQGFTRPKVLILAPVRAIAHEVVEVMMELLGPKTSVANKERFDEEYGPAAGDHEGSGVSDGDDEERSRRVQSVLDRKPADWKALLGNGRNVDDMFTIGISLSPGGGRGKPGEGKGVAVRLYCDFYQSDLVIASPVALHRVAVSTAEEDGEGAAGSNVDSDFLSSVEVCIMDRADVFLMQNWAYVPEIAELINARPTGERAGQADFSRVRPLFLHDQGRLFRQTIILSSLQDPNLNALVSRHCRNHEGIVKVWRGSGDGRICEVAVQAKQVFQRVPADCPASQDDARFEYFVGTVLPQVLRARQSHTAVFIPSYFDYVRVRNHLMKSKASVVNVHEYSRSSEVSRSRSRFFRGDRDLILYTGRAHFFNRFSIRGIHHIIFYSLPLYPQFYPEIVNLLEEAESIAPVTCLALFTRFDRLRLEPIVGEKRADHMLRSSKNTFLFC